jgi:hypothetical protein
MSAWLEALGWCWIAFGAYTTWRDSRLLVSRPYRLGELSNAQRRARRKALTGLRLTLFYIVVGVVWVTRWYAHPIIGWLGGGYVVVLVSYDLSAWFRSRKRRKTGSQTAGRTPCDV